MTKYIVEQKEVWIQKYEVEAESEEEAIDKVNDGEGIEVGEPKYHQLLSDYTTVYLDAYEKEEGE